MKSVLVFVMGSDASPYPQLMQASRETWDSADVEFVPTWYFSNHLRNNPPRTIQLNVGNDLCDMGHKCLEAYRWALINSKWDYMARVNASCYVRKSVLLDHVQSLPETGVMRGLVVPNGHGKIYMWGGGQFIISRDVVQAMVDSADKWNHNEMEDVAMSELTKELGIAHDGQGRCCSINIQKNGWLCLPYNGSPGFEFTDFEEFKQKAGDQFFIRVKQDCQRDKDIWIMRKLWSLGLT